MEDLAAKIRVLDIGAFPDCTIIAPVMDIPGQEVAKLLFYHLFRIVFELSRVKNASGGSVRHIIYNDCLGPPKESLSKEITTFINFNCEIVFYHFLCIIIVPRFVPESS